MRGITWDSLALFGILSAILLWRFEIPLATILIVALGGGAYAAIRLSLRGKK